MRNVDTGMYLMISSQAKLSHVMNLRKLTLFLTEKPIGVSLSKYILSWLSISDINVGEIIANLIQVKTNGADRQWYIILKFNAPMAVRIYLKLLCKYFPVFYIWISNVSFKISGPCQFTTWICLEWKLFEYFTCWKITYRISKIQH